HMSIDVQNANPLFAGVPAMPDYFIGRDDLLNTLVDQLLSGQTEALCSEGIPGAGKTTLAVAIAHDPRIRQHYSDRVLWASLVARPDMMSPPARWADPLPGHVPPAADAAARARATKPAIGQRPLLLVIDDARQFEPTRLLRCGGPNCCHLLTTRDPAIAHAF